ncbi:hypothetical protein BKI52_26230 [marine bacterium AO1-C]|nr:hypothetical protein BKI52_26230 [marine bacterium AO1-C]
MNKIQEILSELIGLPFTRSTRAANMECLKFGEHFRVDNGEKLNIGELGLHLQCPWRIVQGDKLLIGSLDVYEPIEPNKPYDPDFDWDVSGGNLRDKKVEDLLNRNQLVVQHVEVDAFGGFELIFNQGVRFQVFPANSSQDQYNEYWRLLKNNSDQDEHYVMDSSGFWEIS